MLPRIPLQNFENCANLPKMHKQENFKTDFIFIVLTTQIQNCYYLYCIWFQFLTKQNNKKISDRQIMPARLFFLIANYFPLLGLALVDCYDCPY